MSPEIRRVDAWSVTRVGFVLGLVFGGFQAFAYALSPPVSPLHSALEIVILLASHTIALALAGAVSAVAYNLTATHLGGIEVTIAE